MSAISEILQRAEEINKILVAGIAFTATIIGPLVTSWISRRNEVTKLREKWLSDLRDSLVNLEGNLANFDCLISDDSQPDTDTGEDSKSIKINDNNSQLNKEFQKVLVENVMIIARIQLLLNPKQHDHICLSRAIAHLDYAIRNKKDDLVGKRRAYLRKIEKRILKNEWDNISKMVIIDRKTLVALISVCLIIIGGIVCLA